MHRPKLVLSRCSFLVWTRVLRASNRPNVGEWDLLEEGGRLLEYALEDISVALADRNNVSVRHGNLIPFYILDE